MMDKTNMNEQTNAWVNLQPTPLSEGRGKQHRWNDSPQVSLSLLYASTESLPPARIWRPCRGGKKSLPLLILRSQAGALYTGLTKDKLTREKHKNLFSISFMWHRRIHKEWRPEEAVKPKYFYPRFDEDWKAVVKCDRTKGCEIKLVNWGKLSKAWSFGFLLASLHLWR